MIEVIANIIPWGSVTGNISGLHRDGNSTNFQTATMFMPTAFPLPPALPLSRVPRVLQL